MATLFNAVSDFFAKESNKITANGSWYSREERKQFEQQRDEWREGTNSFFYA